MTINSALVAFADSKAKDIQRHKDEYERLKKKEKGTRAVMEKIMHGRVLAIHQLIAENCELGVTNDVKSLQDILEALVRIYAHGVTLAQFPDLSFSPDALAVHQKSLLFVGNSPYVKVKRDKVLSELERELYIQSHNMCSTLLAQSKVVDELKSVLREGAGMLTPAERGGQNRNKKLKDQRANARIPFAQYIEEAAIELENLQEETLVTSPLLKKWKEINRSVWRGNSNRADAIDEVHIQLNEFLESVGDSKTSAKRKRKSSNDLDCGGDDAKSPAVSSDDE